MCILLTKCSSTGDGVITLGPTNDIIRVSTHPRHDHDMGVLPDEVDTALGMVTPDSGKYDECTHLSLLYR